MNRGFERPESIVGNQTAIGRNINRLDAQKVALLTIVKIKQYLQLSLADLGAVNRHGHRQMLQINTTVFTVPSARSRLLADAKARGYLFDRV